jgi:hypothetical protein
MRRSDEVRFFTSADSRFFVAAAAMLNSLRLSRRRGAAFVVDVGQRPEQREGLTAVAEVLDTPRSSRGAILHSRN